MTEHEAEILTVDVGTSSLKAVLYGLGGQIKARSTQRYSYDSAQPGWAEGNPGTWWQAFCHALADLRARGTDLGSVAAVSFTGQMHTAVLLDDDGRVIPPTILWLDRRADRETEELQRNLRLPPYQLNSTYTLPKLVWLYRNMPDAVARVRTILWPKDYLRFRLTGEVCTDLTEAGGAALLDWETRTWATERLALAGLTPEVLPPIRPADGDAGAVLPQVARELGLNPRARVVVGMGDVAALFGGAPPKPGRVVCSLGSSSMVFAALAEGQAVLDPLGRLYVYPFGPYPLLGGVSSTTGASVVWAWERLCDGRERGLTFEDCVHAALQVEPGAGGVCFVPYLAGERSPYWSDTIRGGFYGLQLAHDWRYLVRAVMEGVAHSLRHLLDVYAEIGAPAQELALAAGGVTTPGLVQIIADVCQRDVSVYAGEETVTRVLFALCRASLGMGEFQEGLLRTFESPKVISCRRDLARVYDEAYGRYRAFSAFAAEQAQQQRDGAHPGIAHARGAEAPR